MAAGSGSNPNPARDPLSSSRSRSTSDRQGARRFNLLLAEDNLPDALIVREAILLEDLPFDVHIAADGQQAAEFIQRAEEDDSAPRPDFLLLDLNLPKIDGFEVLRRLRAGERCKAIPVLIITSSDAPQDLERAAALGAGYFRKPPNYEEFIKLGGLLRKLLVDRGVL